MSYDAKCYELAEWFLDDEHSKLQTDANKARIAQRVQDVIEDEIECIKQDADAGAEEDVQPGYRDRDEWRHEAVEAQRLK